VEEKMVGLIPVLKKPKSFGRWDTYALVITDQRLVFAQLTSKMLKEAAVEAQRKGKEEGKGFFSRWADQLKATMAYSQRYWDISPEQALHENSGNFSIPNQEIKKMKIKRKDQSGWGDEAQRLVTELKIESNSRKMTFNVDNYDNDIKNSLQNVFGDRFKG